MVRGSAALLVAAAYFVCASALPGAGAYVPAVCGAVAVGLGALAPLAGRDEPVGLAILGVGALVLAIALNAHGVVAQATPAEVLFAACAGLLFAFGFAAPAAAVALPVLVGGIDLTSLFGDSQATVSSAHDMLSLSLPAWGSDPLSSVPALGSLDATFLALYASWAVRYGMHPRVVVPLMIAGLAVALVLSLALDRSIPTLPFLGLAFLVPNLRRIPHVLRSEG